MEHTATYSPEDNKLRLYPACRLSSEEYERVKAAGFSWAPKQQIFVAPMWTPGREDLLTDMCGEIGDEDTSLVERAAERAERFEEYSDKRAADAERAHAAVAAIADNIPLGQPILVGHHSEKHARKDAERIDSGMRRAVSMWKTSKYWEQRAAGALAHAKYKERPDVRARRIKKLEAEARKTERERVEAQTCLDEWGAPDLTPARAEILANYGRPYMSKCFTLAEYPRGPEASQYEGSVSIWSALTGGIINMEQARGLVLPHCRRVLERCARWAEHYENRITYERAMLDEQGASELLAPKPRPKQLPLCNYRAPEGLNIENIYHRGEMNHYPQVEMTQAEYARINKDHKGTREIGRSHRVRVAMRSRTDADTRRGYRLVCVFITDSKMHEPPAPVEPPPLVARVMPAAVSSYTPPERTKFDDLQDTLKAGVQVVTAPQLFPTPPDLAARMVELSRIEAGARVLEPSAGTGRILAAIRERLNGSAVRTAVEVNGALCDTLRAREEGAEIVHGDFLEQTPDTLGRFDAVLMNPPFKDAADIRHILHAAEFLTPGGTLVAICANGPRQQDKLMPLASYWEDLPAGTFEQSGTNVNTALLIIDN